MARSILLLALLLLGTHVACAVARLADIPGSREVTGAPQGSAAGGSRRLRAVQDGRDAALLGGPQGAAAARLCVMQCLQHACISWHKIYMDADAGGASLRPEAVPASSAECMGLCGLADREAGCMAQTFQRLLNGSPLQFSCSSSCISGLLHSSCSQCGGSSRTSACGALQGSGSSLGAAECLVDAAAFH